MDKSQRVYKKVLDDIIAGEYGASGSKFITTRELSDKYGVSLVTAHKIKQLLFENNNICQIGRKSFITMGTFDNTSDVQKVYNKTKMIGFHFSKINNPYFSEIAKCASEYASSIGYNLVIMCSNGNAEYEKMALDQFFDMRVIGVVSYEGTYPEKDYDYYRNYPLPVVLLSSEQGTGRNDMSSIDNKFMAKQIATHLVEMGYTKFMYVSTSNSSISQLRFDGFQEELNKYGYDVENKNEYYFENVQSQFYPVLKKHMKSEPIGIFCYHDIVASNVLSVLDKHDVRYPQDVGVVGFDNLTDLTYDIITTVEYSKLSVVKQAIDLLVNKTRNEEFKTRYIPGYMIIRRSSSRRKP